MRQSINNPTATQYRRALLDLKLSNRELQLLVCHYRASSHTITANDLAEKVGFKNYRATNLHYGKIAKKIGAALRMTGDIGIGAILTGIPPARIDGNSHWRLTMRPALAAALRGLRWAAETPAYWVLKSRPDRNQLKGWLRPGRKDTWRTSKPPKNWANGDRLFVWEAAPSRQLVGLAVIEQIPSGKERKHHRSKFIIRFLTRYLPQPVAIDEARAEPELKHASFLKSGPSATLYSLSRGEAKVLFELLGRKNPELSQNWFSDIGLARKSSPLVLADVDQEAIEGQKRLRSHLQRERAPGFARKKKEHVLHIEGKLACEVCGFDFNQQWGKLGYGFCEVHHKKPLASRNTAARTRFDELAIVCSNCHRVIHKTSPMKTIQQMRKLLRSQSSAR